MRLRDLGTIAGFAAAAIFGIVAASFAQTINGGQAIDPSLFATKAQFDALVAAMPVPANTVPPSDAATGAVGAEANTFMRGDAVRQARYRSSSCTLAGGTGACRITWSKPFDVTPNPLGDPSALNTSPATLQHNCNWTALDTTGGNVICRSSVLGIAVLGNIWSLLSNGVVVTGNAIQPM